MLLPCDETYKRMVGAHAGLWPELVNDGSDIELAVKLGADLAKAILKGAKVTLVIAVVRVSGKSIRVVGLKIEDDINDPAFLQQPQERIREQRLFDDLLAKDYSWLTFFDELVRPVMSARVVWNKEETSKAIAELQRTSPHYQGDSLPLLEEAMTRALEDCGKWHRGEGKLDAIVWATIPLQFQNLQPLNVSSAEAGEFSVDDSDEGGALEKSTYLLLEANFPGIVYLNPQFDDGAVRKEFADVLVVTERELFIVQSKVMAMLDRDPSQKTSRRVANVFSNFQKAVSQLGGSVRMLRSGKIIYTKHGVPIETNFLEKSIHGIVLLSTTNLPLPWHDIAGQLVAASKKAQAKFHLLDFIEFQQHIAFGKHLTTLGAYLDRRFEVVDGSGNANLKIHFVNEENKPITSAPIEDDEAGYVFTFELERDTDVDAARVLKSFTKALKGESFNGRCEYFQGLGLIEGEKYFWVSLGLRWERETEQSPSYEWWIAFAERVRANLEANSNLKLTHLSEMATLGEIRANHTLALVIEFVNGKSVGFLDPDNPSGEGE